uniref:Uncharacterized protein n=1 Tax=Oryza brachyantha TaxID=4533 RepID=J3LUT1_ORYBR
MPPQLPTSRVRSTAAISSPIPAAKRPSSISTQPPAKKIMARPSSAPAPPAISPAAAAAKKIARPMTTTATPPPPPAISSPIAAAKRPSSISSQPPAKKIMARPSSAPAPPAISPAAAAAKKIARPMTTTTTSNLAPAAPSAAKPRPPFSNSKTATPKKPGAPYDARPRPPCSNSKKPARPASGLSEPPVAAVSVSVHPVRRLTCGTAVYVRTRYVKITARCCLVIWLPARVVSSSDAYQYTVKYAADLHTMFAGRVVRVPVGNVRPAPHRATAAAERSVW